VSGAALDRENPWPGLASYDEAAWPYFNGRSAEIEELTRRIVDEPLTVLFGRSGLGKSSLLKAGVFPRLRELGFVPIYIRLHFRDAQLGLTEQVRAYFEQELREQRIEYPEWPADESLWQFLHRADFELWTEKNKLVRPVFVFDQFEEVFTLGRKMPQLVERFRTELADLIENRIPASLASQLEALNGESTTLDMHATRCKVVISLREDFLADLEGWRAAMPSLRHNRMRLLPMDADNAKEAICNERTRHLIDETRAAEIVGFLSGQSIGATGSALALAGYVCEQGEIDPALLSLFCARVNERRKSEHKLTIDEALVAGARQTVVTDFYRDCVKDQPASARHFIEEELVTEQGFRNSFAVEDALKNKRLTQAQLDALVDRRLLRRSHLLGTDRIELTHDILTKAVVEHRNLGRHKEHERRLLAYVGACVLLVGTLGYMFFQDLQRDKEESGRQLAEAKALSQQLAAMSRRELERSHEQATLLGLEALNAADTLEAREALIHAARYAWPSAVLADASELGGSPVAVAVSNDGQQLGIVARNGAESSVSMWDVQDADARKPKRLWRTKVATEASSLVFARDKSRIAVGGALGVELLDTKLGERELMLPEAGPVKALAFGSKGQVVWSTERQLHVWGRDPVSQTTEHIDIAGVEEISMDSRGRILALSRLPDGSLAPSLVESTTNGAWRKKRLPIDCGAIGSASIGGSRYSAIVPYTSCGFTVDADGTALLDDEFAAADARQSVAVKDVVWARVGAAHVKLMGAGEMLIVGPKMARRWSMRLKGVALPDEYAENLADEVSLSSSGLRLAAIARGDPTRSEPAQKVIVHYLEQRPFLAEIRKGAVTVDSAGNWIALERQPVFGSPTSTIAIFQRSKDSAFVPASQIVLESSPESLEAVEGSLVVRRKDASGVAIVERFAVNQPNAAAQREKVDDVVTRPRPSEERQESLESPRGGYQIVVAERGNRAVERLEVRHRASGATFGLPRMTQRQHLRFSSDDRWLVFWDDRGVEVLDLKERRHVGKFDIANVHAASFEGSSGILRLDFGELSMLVPLELEMTKAMASSLVTRPFDAAARCAYMGKDCDRAATLPRPSSTHTASMKRSIVGFRSVSPTAETIAAK
jgi:hypothetical protein